MLFSWCTEIFVHHIQLGLWNRYWMFGLVPPDFYKPLGEPSGDMVKEGWKLSHEFKHAAVWGKALILLIEQRRKL